MPGYGLQDAEGVFSRSVAVFEEITADLAGLECAALTHADLEEHLQAQGRRLMRQLFQDHADLRAVREERLAVVTGSDQVKRSRVERGRTRSLGTVFGKVTVERLAYRAVGAGNLYPADAAWNLPPGLHSHGLTALVVQEVVRGSFEQAQAAIERATGQRIGKRQIEQLTVHAAADIADFYTGRRPGPVGKDTLLVLTCDGKGVVMRPDALRPATAKAAAQAGKLATRLSPGEKNGRKRMAELACVYDAEPAPRTSGDVIAKPGMRRDPRRAKGPVAAGKWLTGSVTSDAAAVIAAAFEEAERRDPDHERAWVVLVDGHNHQLDTIRAEAAERGVQVHILVDFVHVAEYVWGAAWSFFDKGDPDAEHWVAGRLTKILEGKAEQVATGILARATRFGYRQSELTGAQECVTYLRNKAPTCDMTPRWPPAGRSPPA